MRFLLVILFLLQPLLVSAATLRLEDDRAWLESEGTPLIQILMLFKQRGVEVLVDPSLELNRVSGTWENTKVERLIQQLVGSHSYLLEWRRIDSSLGALYQVASIRIYSDGNLSAVKPLDKKGRVLDIIEGKDGLNYIRGEIMVGFGEGADIADLKALLKKIGGTVIEVIDPPGVYRIKLNEGLSVEDAMKIAQAHEGVEAIEPNYAFSRIGSEQVQFSGSGEGVNLHLKPGETAVAVFDSGLDPAYADLPFIRGTYNALSPDEAMSDSSGHGTLTAMVASGAITPRGAAPAETGVPVLAIRTFDEHGMTSSDTIMRALEYAANSGATVVNMSWGSEVESRFMETAMDYAALNGMTLYASAGNKPTGTPVYPASYDSVIAVGGLRADGSQWEQSNFGAHVKIYEPAEANFNGKSYIGTSIASPYAAFKRAQ